VTLGVVSFAVAAALAKPMGRYFHSDILPRVILVQSTVYIIASFQSVPTGRLSRDLRFKRLASLDVARSVVASGAAIALAVAGARYWTLVVGELIAATVHSVLLVWSAPTGFRWSEFGRVRHAIVFGGRLLAASLAWYVYSNADFFVAGRVLGAVALGSYTFAWQLTSLPVEKVTALVARVTPALLAAASSDRVALRRYVSRLTEGIALLTFPATVGMALVAPDIIPIVFGTKWALAIVPFQFLAGGMVLRSIVPVLSNAMRAVHDVRFMMWHSIATALVLPPAFFAAAHLGGLRGIALTWLVLYPIVILPQYWRAVRMGVVDVRGYLKGVLPAVEGTVLMAVVVVTVRWALLRPATPPAPAWRCLIEIVAGIAAYIAVIALRHGARVRAALAFVRRRDG
jgi:PST family polysaccharide transporter